MPLTAKEIVKLLKKNGWYRVGGDGSHLKFAHPDVAKHIVVSMHGGDMKPGTLNAILKQAGLKKDKQ